MPTWKMPLSQRSRHSARASLIVMSNPVYALVATFSAASLLLVNIWIQNITILRYVVLYSPLPLAEKVSFIFYGYQYLYSSITDSRTQLLIILVIIFGINISMAVFVLRARLFRVASWRLTLTAGVATLFSGSCAACGTSLIAPLVLNVSTISAVSAYALNTLVLLASIGLLLYSILLLGASVPINQQPKPHDKKA